MTSNKTGNGNLSGPEPKESANFNSVIVSTNPAVLSVADTGNQATLSASVRSDSDGVGSGWTVSDLTETQLSSKGVFKRPDLQSPRQYKLRSRSMTSAISGDAWMDTDSESEIARPKSRKRRNRAGKNTNNTASDDISRQQRLARHQHWWLHEQQRSSYSS